MNKKSELHKEIFIYRTGVKIELYGVIEYDEYGNELISYYEVEPNELGIERVNRYLNRFLVNGDWLEQGDFDLVYKMFGERVNRENEISYIEDWDMEKIIEDLINELYWNLN